MICFASIVFKVFIIIPFIIIIMPLDGIVMPLHIIIMLLNSIIMPHNIIVMQPNILFMSLNPAITEKFFSEFWSDFSAYFPLRSLDMSSERKFFFAVTGSMLFRCNPICPFSTHRGACPQVS